MAGFLSHGNDKQLKNYVRSLRKRLKSSKAWGIALLWKISASYSLSSAPPSLLSNVNIDFYVSDHQAKRYLKWWDKSALSLNLWEYGGLGCWLRTYSKLSFVLQISILKRSSALQHLQGFHHVKITAVRSDLNCVKMKNNNSLKASSQKQKIRENHQTMYSLKEN